MRKKDSNFGEKHSTGVKKKSVGKKQKIVTISKLQETLWKLCREIIRKTQPNECYTCRRGGLEGSNWHTGHGPLPKTVLNIENKYHLSVLRSQCYDCNINKGGMGAEFLERWKEENEMTDQEYKEWKLEATKSSLGGVDTRIFLEKKIEEYKELLNGISTNDLG